MSLSRIRNIKNDNLTWPGFVDALAALLMVVIFVLMIFSIAQFYLNQIVSGQDEALFDLNKEINSLYNLLQIEKDQNSDLKNQINIINIKLESKKASFRLLFLDIYGESNLDLSIFGRDTVYISG